MTASFLTRSHAKIIVVAVRDADNGETLCLGCQGADPRENVYDLTSAEVLEEQALYGDHTVCCEHGGHILAEDGTAA